jgi:hypothetical protein
MMNWDAIGAVGEVIGAIAVVCSIVYLAIQIRQGTSATAAGNMNSWTADYNQLLMALYYDPSDSVLFRRAIKDFESMSADDQTRAHALLSASALSAQNAYFQSSKNQFDARLAKPNLWFMVSIIKSDGGQYWWSKMRGYWHEDFTEEMENLAKSEEILAFDKALPWYAKDA